MVVKTGNVKTSSRPQGNYQFFVQDVHFKKDTATNNSIYSLIGAKDKKKFIVNFSATELKQFLNTDGVTPEEIAKIQSNANSLANLAKKSLKEKEYLFQVTNLTELNASERFSVGDYVTGTRVREIVDKSVDLFEPQMAKIPFRPYKVPYFGPNPRIGYSNLPVPINAVSITRQSDYDEIPTLRSHGTVKKGTGYSYESYNVSYIVDGADEIRGGVVDVLNLLNLTPFISAEGTPFSALAEGSVIIQQQIGDIPYTAFAVKNYSVSTIPGMPNQLMVTLSLEPFNYQYYVPPYVNDDESTYYGKNPRLNFDDMICWPLVKLWARTRSRYIPKLKFDGRLAFYFLNKTGSAELDNVLTQDLNRTFSQDDSGTLDTLDALIRGDVKQLNSKYTSEILSTHTTNRMFTLKLNNSNSWVSLLLSGRSQVKGLIDWSKLENKASIWASTNNTVSYGAFVQNHPANSNTFGTVNTSIPTIVDVELTGDLNTNIKNYIYTKHGINPALPDPVEGDVNYQKFIHFALPETLKAQENPYTYFALLFETKNETDQNKLQRLIRSTSKAVAPKIQNTTFSGRIREGVLKNENNKDILLDTTTNGEVIVEQISGNKGFTLGLKTMQVDPLPLHEYLGGTDTTIVIQGKCTSAKAKAALNKVKEQYDNQAVNKTSEKFNTESSSFGKISSLLGVDNEIFQMLGVDFIVPVNISFESVDGEPNVWNFVLTCLEHNIQNLQQEKIKFLDTETSNLAKILDYDSNGTDRTRRNPTVSSAIEYISMTNRLAKEEVYPDMQLPTYRELSLWINSLRRLAKAWDGCFSPKGTNIKVSGDKLKTKAVADKYNLSEFDYSVLDNCLEFFEYDHTPFLSWEDPVLPIGVTGDQYVDPDFYCYYEDYDDWKKLVDDVAEAEHGPRKGLTADKKKETENIEVRRKIHGDLGDVVSLYPPEASQNNPANISDMYQQIRDSYMYPTARANQVKKYQEEADKSFDEKAGEKSWWGSASYLETKDQGKKQIRQIKSTQAELVKFLSNSPDLQQPAPEQGANPNDQVEKNIFGFDNTPIDYNVKFAKQLNNVRYRLEILERFQKEGNNLGSKISIGLAFSGGSLMAIDKGQVFTDRRFIPNLADIGDAYNQKDNLNIKFNDVENRAFDNSDYQQLLNELINVDGIKYGYVRTLKLNSNFGSLDKRAVDFNLQPTRGDMNYLFQAYEDYFAYYGKEYKIDPTVIKSILLRREALGTAKIRSIPDELFTKEGLDPNVFSARIKLVSKLYADGLNKFEIPSLALLYVEAHINPTERQKWLDTQGNISNDLNLRLAKLKSKYVSNKFGQGAIDMSKELKEFGQLAYSLNEYWSAYIEISRTFGSYLGVYNDKKYSFKVDGFFNNKHPLIVMDVDDNQEVVLDIPGPAGLSVNVDFGRTSIEALSWDNRTARVINTENLADTFSRSPKFKSAQDPQSEAALYGFISDMRNYGVYGRLLGAFPTVQTVIINEGFFYVNGSQKLWDQYYTRSGIADIEVFKSRNMAADTCSITYSNMFHFLSAYALEEAHAESLARAARDRYTANLTNRNKNTVPLDQGGFGQLPANLVNNIGNSGTWATISDIFNNAVLKKIPEDLISLWRNNRLKQLAMHPGARLQVRLGYGSNASRLPVIFNGTVVSCPLQDGYMTLTAVGDGLELERQITKSLVPVDNGFNYQDSGAFGIGKDPSSIVTEALVGGSLTANLTGGRFGRDDNGISHFGQIIYGPNGSHKPYETQINIYSSSPTKIEQGITYLRNYFNVNALYNFDDVNTFSISIKEPTVWKVANVCANACLDFVTSAQPFAARSTLFFGKWWYPYHYDWHPDIINFQADSELIQVSTTSRITGEVEPFNPGSSTSNGNISKATSVQPTPKLKSGGTIVPVKSSLPNGLNGVFSDFRELAAIKENPNDKYLSQKPLRIPPNIIVSNDPVYSSLWNLAVSTYGGVSKFEILVEGEVVRLWPTAKSVVSVTRVVYKKTPQGWVKITSDISATSKTYSNSNEEAAQKVANDFTKAAPEIKKSAENIKLVTEEGVDLPYVTNSDSTYYELAFANQLDLIKDVETLTRFCRSKNYMQAYIVCSQMNLLENRMSLNSEKFATDAVGTHLENGLLHADGINKTITYNMDSNIISADRKTAVIDTGLLVTNIQKGPARAIAQGLTSLGVSRFVPAISDFVNETPATPAVNNSVVSGLAKMARDMYDGEIVCMFQPTMKPGDLIQFEDLKSSLKGPLFVKEVVHKLNVKSGSMTVIVPDLVALPASSIIGLHTIENLSQGVLQKSAHYFTYKGLKTVGYLMAKSRNKRTALNLAADVYAYNSLEDIKLEDIKKLQGVDTKDAMDKLANQINERLEKLTEEVKELSNKGKKQLLEERVKAIRQLIGSLDTKVTESMVTEQTIIDGKVWNTTRKVINDPNSPEKIIRLARQMEALDLGTFDLSKLDVTGTDLYQEIFKFRQELDRDVREFVKLIKNKKVTQFSGRNEKELMDALEKWVNNKKGDFFKKIIAREDFPADLKAVLLTEQEALKTLVSVTNKLDPNKKYNLIQQLKDKVKAKGTGLTRKETKAISKQNKKEVQKAIKFIQENGDALAEIPESFVNEFIKGELLLTDIANSVTELQQSDLGQVQSDLSKLLAAEDKLKFKEFLANSDNKVIKKAKGLLKSKALSPAASISKKGEKILDAALVFYHTENKLKAIKDGYKTVRLMSLCGPQVLFSAAKEVAMMTIGDQFILGVNARLAAMHSVVLVPLMSTKSRIPYVAGIRGHQGAVIGDTVGWADNLISGYLTGKDGGIGNITSVVATVFGVETPEWASMNRQDQQLMQNIYGDTFGDLYHEIHLAEVANKVNGTVPKASSVYYGSQDAIPSAKSKPTGPVIQKDPIKLIINPESKRKVSNPAASYTPSVYYGSQDMNQESQPVSIRTSSARNIPGIFNSIQELSDNIDRDNDLAWISDYFSKQVNYALDALCLTPKFDLISALVGDVERAQQNYIEEPEEMLTASQRQSQKPRGFDRPKVMTDEKYFELRKIVFTEMKKQGLARPYWRTIMALIETESGFSNLTSSSPAQAGPIARYGHKGASIGFMQVQIMTAWDRKLLPVEDSKLTEAKLLDPQTNIRCGIAIFKQNLDKARNALVALAAYNGGWGNRFGKNQEAYAQKVSKYAHDERRQY